jgi:hypothetical protein
MDTYSRQLVFHGAVVLLIGLLCGAPYGRAVNRKAPEHIVHSWRVAHASIPLGAALMFGVAAVLSDLQGGASLKWVVAVAKLVYLGNMIGAVSSLVAAAALLYAAWVSL